MLYALIAFVLLALVSWMVSVVRLERAYPRMTLAPAPVVTPARTTWTPDPAFRVRPVAADVQWTVPTQAHAPQLTNRDEALCARLDARGL